MPRFFYTHPGEKAFLTSFSSLKKRILLNQIVISISILRRLIAPRRGGNKKFIDLYSPIKKNDSESL